MSDSFEDLTTGNGLLRGLLVAVFVAGLAYGPISYAVDGPVLEDVKSGFPEPELEPVLDGTWAPDAESWLIETSAVALGLRGWLLANQWSLGLLESPHVHHGDPGWLFLSGPLDGRLSAMNRLQPQRERFWKQVAAKAQTLGVEVLVLMVPDKERVHPNRAYASGVMPPNKVGIYERGLQEIRDAGLSAVDLRPALDALQREHPEIRPFARRDTHWDEPGAAVAARAAATWLRGTFPERLAPALPMLVASQEAVMSLDIAEKSMGLLPSTTAGEMFLERRQFTVSALLDGAGRIQAMLPSPDAPVALCGDSFSRVNFQGALPAFLGFTLDTRGAIAGAGPCRGVAETLDRIEAGEAKARAVLLVFIERSLSAPHWTNVPKGWR